MKYLLLPLFVLGAIGLAAQSDAGPAPGFVLYGAAITPDSALSMAEFEQAIIDLDSMEVKLAAEAVTSCAKKGCWMTVNMSDGATMMVRFRDYGFFVPTEGMEGKQIVIEGTARKQVTSVDMLRHYAEDAGKSEEEIALITEPEEGWTFEAVGVLVQQ